MAAFLSLHAHCDVDLSTNVNIVQASTDQIIQNLQRENAMITTAWYDLTSRLQSNHVVLQRRHDVPKSWLNKQRQMVNGEFCSAATSNRASLADLQIATPRR